MSKPARTKSLHPWVGIAIMVLSGLGLLSSVMLLQSELDVLADPDANLICDVNPLIGCSSSLLSPQAHLLGIPNSALGLVAFGALLALGAVVTFRGTLPKIVWLGISAGALAGLAFVVFFLFASVTEFRTLCPYCMLTWVATLGILPLALGGAASTGSFGTGSTSAGRSILRYSWAIALVLYLLVVLVIVITLSDKIGFLF